MERGKNELQAFTAEWHFSTTEITTNDGAFLVFDFQIHIYSDAKFNFPSVSGDKAEIDLIILMV